jgi:hypothetical protein
VEADAVEAVEGVEEGKGLFMELAILKLINILFTMPFMVNT